MGVSQISSLPIYRSKINCRSKGKYFLFGTFFYSRGSGTVKISAKADYACIAVLELSRQYNSGEPVSISRITDRHGVSQSFLVHIMNDLKKEGIVESIRGSKGGYRLSKSPSSVSIADVVRAIDGRMIDIKCMHPPGQEGCELEPTCDLQSVWDVIKLRVVDVLEELTFDEVQRLASLFEETENGTDEHRNTIRKEAFKRL